MKVTKYSNVNAKTSLKLCCYTNSLVVYFLLLSLTQPLGGLFTVTIFVTNISLVLTFRLLSYIVILSFFLTFSLSYLLLSRTRNALYLIKKNRLILLSTFSCFAFISYRLHSCTALVAQRLCFKEKDRYYFFVGVILLFFFYRALFRSMVR